MNRYDKYKSVSLPWVNEIPEHWEIIRNKNIFMEKKKSVGSQFEKYKLLSLSLKGVIERNLEDGGKFPASFEKYTIVNPKDLVFCLFDIDETPRTIGISKIEGMITSAYNIMAVKKDCAKYMYYFYLYLDFIKGLKPYYSSLRKTVNIDTFNSLKILTPPINEQEQIANYLDWKINEIDRLIQVEKEKIKELELFKQKYIDSQIEAIDCEVQPLKSIFDFGKGLSITKDNLGETGFKCISYGEIHNDFMFSFSSNNPKLKGLEKIGDIVISKFAQLKKGEFVFADTSEDLKGCGNFTYLKDNFQKVYAGYHTVVAKPRLKFNSKYLAYYFQSNKWRKQIRESVKGIKVYSITQQILKSSKIQIPDEEVQICLTDKLDKFIGNINSLSNALESGIKELMNLKQSLISEVVTGKIDVRNVVIPEYEKVTVLDDEVEELDEMEGSEDGN